MPKLENLSLATKQKKKEEEKGVPDNFHKLRIFFKATLLASLHLNPLYFFIALFSLELCAICIDFLLNRE